MEVSVPLLNTLKKLQDFPSLQQFTLGGGTNLALRFKHRKSIDIDLFCTDIIGRKGFENIERELKEFFGKSVLAFTYPCNENDQFIFARCLIMLLLYVLLISPLTTSTFGKSLNAFLTSLNELLLKESVQ